MPNVPLSQINIVDGPSRAGERADSAGIAGERNGRWRMGGPRVE